MTLPEMVMWKFGHDMPDSIALDASQSSGKLAEDRGRSKTKCQRRRRLATRAETTAHNEGIENWENAAKNCESVMQFVSSLTYPLGHNLSHELIRSKRGENMNDYRIFMQRRILIQNKRCAIFTAKLLPESSHLWPTAIFKTPSDDWPEILLYILGDDVFVVPRSQMPYDTTLDLESSRIYDYRNSWCVLDRVDPTSSKAMTEKARHA
jgi:hypothetical protein